MVMVAMESRLSKKARLTLNDQLTYVYFKGKFCSILVYITTPCTNDLDKENFYLAKSISSDVIVGDWNTCEDAVLSSEVSKYSLETWCASRKSFLPC